MVHAARAHVYTVFAEVLICGGGPAGYTTAMALAQRGCQDIRVLERAPDAAFYNPGKAYVYALSPPAKNTLKAFGLHSVDDAGACPPPARAPAVLLHADCVNVSRLSIELCFVSALIRDRSRCRYDAQRDGDHAV